MLRNFLLMCECIFLKPVHIHPFSKSGGSSSAIRVTRVAQPFIGMMKPGVIQLTYLNT
jgi:hypothetical protein